MNKTTDNLRGEVLVSLLTLALGATGALAAAEAAKPAVAAAVPAVEAVQPAKGEDVISLDDLLDDSADAAKKAPQIRVASRPKAPTEAAVKPVEDAKPAATNDAAIAEAAARPATTNAAAVAKASEAAKPGKMSAAQGLFATPLAQDESTLIDISCDDATLADVLRQFRRATGANIISVSSSNLDQRVSATLNHVPWMEALQAILNARRFRLEPRGGIYFVNEDKQAVPEFTRSFVLNHASATELADLFNTTLGGMPVDSKTGKPVSAVNGKSSGKRIATAFDGANVVVVTASEKILADCETIIKAVDKAIPQIYIEARFIEISNEALHKLGMQWNQLESWGATAKGLTGGMEYNNGRAGVYKTNKTAVYEKPESTTTESGNTTTPKSSGLSQLAYTTQNSIVPDAISAASGAGRTAENMSWLNARGFSGQLSADDFRLALSAFESMTDAKVFSNPKIIVSNGKEAKVDMTTKFPHVKVTSQRNNTGNESYVDMATEMQAIPGEDPMMFAKEAFFSWGITLSVKPRISPDGLISVEIVPTISQLDTDVTASGFYEIASDAGSGLYPIIKMKRLITDFTMKDGATAVIGGLSKTEEEDVDSGIPYLRKIPYIGPKIFGWKSRGKVQKEIIVFVTLGIADPADLPKDIGLPQNAVSGREYVNGTKLEPGQREGGVAGLMAFDTRPLEEQRKDDSRTVKIETKPSTEKTGSGTVEIRIVKQPPATPADHETPVPVPADANP